MPSDYFPTHAHSEFSTLDGMGEVDAMAAKIARMGQPGFVLSDHGTMAGTVQGYKASKKHGLAFYPGVELYVVKDVHDKDTRGTRYHLGMMALDFIGYQALVKLTTLSFREDRFFRKPLVDLSDLAFLKDEGLSDHLAVTTGCHFGLVLQQEGKGRLSMLRMLRRWFPHLYVELQNHGIEHPDGSSDLTDATELYGYAQQMGLPVVIGQDSHYIDAKEQPVHDLMKTICYFGDGEDFLFPGGPFHLATAAEAMEVFPDEWHDDIEAGHGDLLDKHMVTLPALDNYKFHVPKVSKTPKKDLRAKVTQGLRDRGLIDHKPSVERAGMELGVIEKMGMPDYFLLTSELTDWCRAHDATVNTRGSANGSMVCFALGISEVDPIKWKVPFDRFLSLDRMKPPDIDIDVSSDKRALLVEHMRHKFPDVMQIATYSKIGITTEEDEDGIGEDKGSVFVQYMAAMRRKDPTFDGKVKPEHRKILGQLGDTAVRKSMGVNAAGFVLPTDNLPIGAYLPLARVVSSNTTVTQFFKDDVDALGYTKLDFLGIKMLKTLDAALLNIGRRPNDWAWIPDNDKDACRLLRSGNGTALFQFEGWSTANGGKEMKVKSTADAILCLALYRPALMNGGQKDWYLHNRSNPGQAMRLHPIFDPILGDTKGVPVFQEHIMDMLKAVGMGFKDWNDLMTAVKASNGNIQGAALTFARIKPIFLDLCYAAGMSGMGEADEAWEAIVGFTEYGFNKAHATSYGLMAYRSAYLKMHYPLEYMAAALGTWVGHKKKEPLYMQEARAMGAVIVRPDVNTSGATWSIHPTRKNALQKGLESIPGIGSNVADMIVSLRPQDGWDDMQQFVDAMPARPVSGGSQWKKSQTLIGVMEKLRLAGALRSLGVS